MNHALRLRREPEPSLRDEEFHPPSGIDVEEARVQDRLGPGSQERPPALPGPRGSGIDALVFRICHTVDGASLYPAR